MHKKQGKMYFIFALHNHQPVGNFTEVIQLNFEKAYRPFLDVVSGYPDIKFTLHNSGILLEWLEQNQPGYLDLLGSLVERGQVEIMGGGFYEPILPVISDEDKKGQINKLSQWIQDRLGVTTRGMWLAERIWEPGLAKPIAQSGMHYIAMDDTHFQEVRVKNLCHYYLTEEEGHRLNVFPISEKLRYLIPFQPPEETIKYLSKHYSEDENRVLVLADDGEKFGGWPETYETVYEKKWLERFFKLLSQNSDWLQTATFSEYMNMVPPRGLIYLPASSYREMKEWSGGFWRNFFIRYPESNRMHKKMLAVRRRIEDVHPEEARDRALNYLWAGQCNCAYWHGVFGGLYLNFLRAGVWENLIKAEEEAEKTLIKEAGNLEFRVEDRDYDGKEELVVITDRFSFLFSPQLGGSMWEFSWRPAAVNFLDTLTRQKEEYHRELFQEVAESGEINDGEDIKSIHDIKINTGEDLKQHLFYDRYPRGALIEHFFTEEVGLEDFRRVEHKEDESLILQPAEMELQEPGESTGGCEERSVIFRRLAVMGGTELSITKQIVFHGGSDNLEIKYYLENLGGETWSRRFGVELNIAFMSGNDEKRYYNIPGRFLEDYKLASVGEEKDVDTAGLCDDWRGFELSFNFSRPSLLWRFPVETISRSESGLEKVYQNSLIMPQWHLELSPGQNWEVEIRAEVRSKKQEAVV